ncbi:MAG: nucleoside hydrolase [Ferroplasma sp.]|uniref:nucleoside hydrolase n=1 Tax=Ferroplasma sp. TaxID=2591003 RepID=UPI0028160DF5|nr:nucleoside hydrolase [Ferroplasma sp.]WMT50420.1 MAG: nucleoside hydrolase [Ferroplasma sp.]
MDKIILIVDTGVDDAMAMILLKRHGIVPEFIVAQSGNSLLENTYRNTVGIANILEFGCPVYPGSYTPLIKPHYYEDFHGKNGLACYKFPDAPFQDKENGIVHMYEALKHGKYRIICTSPLTSLGLLFRLDQDIQKNVIDITIMGGAFGVTPWGKGNMGESEFNIFYDPEAAKIVFGLDVKITVVPLDLTMNPNLSIKTSLNARVGNSVTDFTVKATEFMLEKHGSYELHDPIAAYAAVNSEAFRFISGRIMVDHNGVTSIDETVKSMHRIATEIDYATYHRDIIGVLYL